MTNLIAMFNYILSFHFIMLETVQRLMYSYIRLIFLKILHLEENMRSMLNIGHCFCACRSGNARFFYATTKRSSCHSRSKVVEHNNNNDNNEAFSSSEKWMTKGTSSVTQRERIKRSRPWLAGQRPSLHSIRFPGNSNWGTEASSNFFFVGYSLLIADLVVYYREEFHI